LPRAVLADWCHQAGMSVDSDAIGNLFARREGLNPQAAPVVMGSHLDSPPDGGRFDGSVGVLAALEVVRSLNDAGITTARPLEIVVWTNQQGSRFAPAMLGSAVFAGLLPLASAQVVEDMYGISVATALSGHSGSLPLGRALDAYFELHIEQGPILEQAGLDIGVVTGSQAICWLDATLEGQAAHAGTTPWPCARMRCLPRRHGVPAGKAGGRLPTRRLVTVGQLQIARAARNSVPGQLSFSIDLRHPDEDSMHALRNSCSDSLHAIARARGIGRTCASAGTARRCILMTAVWRHCARLALSGVTASRTW
jgi:N-carbamoyl-L-amino-acid hydrolase